MNDNEAPLVKLIASRVYRDPDDPAEHMHLMMLAPDDDSAVALAAEACRAKGFVKVLFDQIGELTGEPDEEPYLSAYQTALEGEIAMIRLGVESD